MEIKKRSIVKGILLTLVTCYIYGIIWIINVVRDAVRVKDQNDKGILEIILCIFLPFVGWFLVEKKFTEGCEAQGIEHKNKGILYLILSLVGLGFVAMVLMQKNLNDIATVE